MNWTSTGRPTVLALTLLALLGSTPNTARAFDIPVHMRVTNQQVRAMRASVYGQQKGFSPKAVEQIAKANEAVDSLATMSAAYWHSERHFTDENFSQASQRLITLRSEAIQAVSGSNRDGSKAREKLGQALHTLQDFYAHSSWVERGNTSILAGLGKTVFQNPSRASANCPSNPNVLGPNGGGSVTSGYFVGFSVFPSQFGCSLDELPANKCFHGNYSANCTGINKDLDAAGAASHNVQQNPFHARAAALANEATRTYIQGILDALKGNDRALAALLDVKGTLGFVVDDTGSMGSSIAGVSGTINQMVAEVSTDPERAPDNYLLVRFGDPNVGGAMVTEDASALQAAVGAIQPSGGGDCPELSQAGLLNAVNAAMPDSRLYLFSDATAKDSATVNQVIAAAQSRGVELNYGLTGSCSPIDPAYIRGAAETGGQVFRVRPDEIPQLFTVIKPQLQGNQTTIIRRRVDLGSGGTETLIAPVDGYNSGLTIALSVAENNVAAHQTVKVFRPSGIQVASTDPDVKVLTLSTGLVYAFERAEAGVWKVEVEGYGPFTASVRGNSPLAFSRFDFVNPNGDIHGGYDAIAGQPTAGATMISEATLVGPYSTAHFNLIDEAGRVLMPLMLAQEYYEANPEHFLGETALPAEPFRIAVDGTDASGNAYRREYPALYRAQPLDVQIQGAAFVELKKGVPQTVTFTVKNLQSAAASYTIRARDDRGAVTGLAPSTLDLAPGESKDVQLTLQAPAGSADGDTGRVFVTATSTANATLFNSAQLGYSVSANAPPVCTVPSTPKVLWPPNNDMTDLRLADLVSVTDADGDAVALKLVAATQDEPLTRAPDVAGIGTDVASVRASRAGSGDGRVYQLTFEASDGKGGTCGGTVPIHVPHDSASDTAIDSGQGYDATK